MADLERINLIVTGHVDHGKSTGLGHMLFQLGQIHDPKKRREPWRIAERYYLDSRKEGMGSWSYAWILDPLIEERQRGLTINTSFMEFRSQNYIFNLIDAPGHSDFVKNLITGASQADAAILVVSARKGEFEDGVKRAGTASGKYANVIGMTTEHMLLLTSLGITDIVVAINKMDDISPAYDQSRYEEIKKNIKGTFSILMKAINVENADEKTENIKFVPTSGLVGVNLLSKDNALQNLEGHISAAKSGTADAKFVESLEKEKDEVTKAYEAMSWYTGPSLIDALDMLPSPVERKSQLSKQSLRVPIGSVLNIGGVGTVLTGRVASGILKPDDEVLISHTKKSREPTGIQVKSIQEFHKDLPEAAPGDNVGFNIKAKNLGAGDFLRGSVLAATNDAAIALKPGVDGFLSLVLVVRALGKKKKGGEGAWAVHKDYTPVVHCGTSQVACRVTEIRDLQGKEIAELGQNERGMVWMTPVQPIVVEPLAKSPPLGRFALRDSGKTVAVGIVEKVEKDRYGK
ncbi:MAG: GTP-binding protein [Candidatus Hodarchaeales archaeon]|jgi:elongation factor 1-alpha